MKKSLVFGSLLILSLSTSAQQTNLNPFSDLNFRSIGPATMSGRIVDIEVQESDKRTFYVASATGGIWKTNNAGTTFYPVFENEKTHSIGDMAIHQTYPHIVWVGTGERANRQSSSWGDGVYKSNNGGKTWKNTGLTDSHHIGRIVLHPKDTNTVYVAAMGHLWGPNKERGLYRSVDGGNTWQNILFIDENTGVVDVAMDPENPNILYAASYQRERKPFGFHGGGPGSNLYKSIDGGNTWKLINSGLPAGDKGRIGISIYRKNPNVVYICVEQGFQYNASTAYERRKAGIYRSDDKGETWTFKSDWNPRPMYASQILVDPSDDRRIYMMNSYSFSDDGGLTFRTPRQSLHGDDRIVWVDPADSNHVMKGDDGGLGISHDRGLTWLYVTSLPVSQFYRISFDMRKPYNLYGGLQDNGSWMGPSETYLSDGIKNHDWIKTGGGDGFLSLVHPDNQDILFASSQYLGLTRIDLRTMEMVDIRPGDLKGHIQERRNWDAWGPGKEEPELGNAMAPANWDAPYYISHHKPFTLYAGTNQLWKSINNGDSWVSLGNLTSKINRRELKIMGQRPDSLTASLDDGIPYYPTLTVITESPLTKGVLFVGTDDGQVAISQNDGGKWNNVTSNISGMPKSSWISGIESSRFDKNRVYLAVNNYRNNDFGNYLWVSDDLGKTWRSLSKGLPEGVVVRVIKEDLKNENVLYLATEMGLFISLDRGSSWIRVKNNMPTLPFNDIAIHPVENDLILASHGRGIWILDNLSAIQEFEGVKQDEMALFTIPDAEKINYHRAGTHEGDMSYSGENPPRGVKIDFWLSKSIPKKDFLIEIRELDGTLVRTLRPDTTAGVHRIVWDFRERPLAAPMLTSRYSRDDSPVTYKSRSMPGQEVPSGRYKAVLILRDQKTEREFNVLDDPRREYSTVAQEKWTSFMNESRTDIESLVAHMDRFNKVKENILLLERGKLIKEKKELEIIKEEFRKQEELYSRMISLYRSVGESVATPTEDQYSRLDYYQEMLEKMQENNEKLIKKSIEKINKNLPEERKVMM